MLRCHDGLRRCFGLLEANDDGESAKRAWAAHCGIEDEDSWFGSLNRTLFSPLEDSPLFRVHRVVTSVCSNPSCQYGPKTSVRKRIQIGDFSTLATTVSDLFLRSLERTPSFCLHPCNDIRWETCELVTEGNGVLLLDAAETLHCDPQTLSTSFKFPHTGSGKTYVLRGVICGNGKHYVGLIYINPSDFSPDKRLSKEGWYLYDGKRVNMLVSQNALKIPSRYRVSSLIYVVEQ
jgi:hypothetical protein